MKLVRGTNVYPRAVEAIVRGVADVDEFQIHLYTVDGIRDEIEVRVELPRRRRRATRCSPSSGASSPRRTRGCASTSGAPSGQSLPRFELKAKRLVDEREVWGGTGERKAM